MTWLEILDIDAYQMTSAWKIFRDDLCFDASVVVQELQIARYRIHGGDEAHRVPFSSPCNPAMPCRILVLGKPFRFPASYHAQVSKELLTGSSTSPIMRATLISDFAAYHSVWER